MQSFIKIVMYLGLFALIIFSTSLLQTKITQNQFSVQQKSSGPGSVLKGINFGNALEAPQEGEWGVYISDSYIESVKKAGFSLVRIPIRWNAHAISSPPYTIESEFFKRIDHVVNESLTQDLTTIINIHHYEALMEHPETHKERFLALWGQIANRYQNHSQKLYFEILNEPMGELNNTLWNQYLVEAIDVIRVTNPNRMLIAGPTNWNNLNQLKNLEIPEHDNNLMVTYHYYSPFQFTHQGAGWVGGSYDWLGTTWNGTIEEKAAIDADFDQAATWAEEHNVSLLLGEFGAFEKADMESRARWTAYVRSAAEERGIHWAYWEFAAGFGVYDRPAREYRLPLLEALLPDSPLLTPVNTTSSSSTNGSKQSNGFILSSIISSLIALIFNQRRRKKKK